MVLLTHGEFSKGICQSASLILGDVSSIKTISITLKDDISFVKEELNETVNSFNNDKPVVILTDIPGGSTTRVALQYLMEKENVYVITGLNLGLLLELALLDLKKDCLDDLKQVILNARNSIDLLNNQVCTDNIEFDDDEL